MQCIGVTQTVEACHTMMLNVVRLAHSVSITACNNMRPIRSLTARACTKSTELMPSNIAGTPIGHVPKYQIVHTARSIPLT